MKFKESEKCDDSINTKNILQEYIRANKSFCLEIYS